MREIEVAGLVGDELVGQRYDHGEGRTCRHCVKDRYVLVVRADISELGVRDTCRGLACWLPSRALPQA
jgi:hypothetical protein